MNGAEEWRRIVEKEHVNDSECGVLVDLTLEITTLIGVKLAQAISANQLGT